MNQRQTNLILMLVIANIVLFACGVFPAVALYLDLGGIQSQFIGWLPAPSPTATNKPPTATPTRILPTPTIEPGWKLYRFPEEQFAIATPASWESMAFTQANLAAQLDLLAQRNSQLANSLKKQPLDIVGRVIFIGYETSTSVAEDGIAPNVNVIHDLEGRGVTLDTWLVSAQTQVAEFNPSIDHFQMQAGEMAEVRFTMPMTLSDGQTMKLSSVQYFILRGRNSYSISCVLLDKQAAKYAPICEKIGLSFRWLDAP